MDHDNLFWPAPEIAPYKDEITGKVRQMHYCSYQVKQRQLQAELDRLLAEADAYGMSVNLEVNDNTLDRLDAVVRSLRDCDGGHREIGFMGGVFKLGPDRRLSMSKGDYPEIFDGTLPKENHATPVQE